LATSSDSCAAVAPTAPRDFDGLGGGVEVPGGDDAGLHSAVPGLEQVRHVVVPLVGAARRGPLQDDVELARKVGTVEAQRPERSLELRPEDGRWGGAVERGGAGEEFPDHRGEAVLVSP
jgi:hypothetical protein